MKNEFSLEDEEPLELACSESIFDIEMELQDPTAADSRHVRLEKSREREQENQHKQEVEKLQKQREKLIINFAKEYFRLQKVINRMQNQNMNAEFSGIFNLLVDISVHLEEIFKENKIEIEDVTGQPLDHKLCHVLGSVKVDNLASDIVVETLSPVVRDAGRIIHHAQVMVSS